MRRRPGQASPCPCWQWGLFVGGLPYGELGADGHPARGGFLPPADNRNRMWAGGRVDFLQPLRAGSKAHTESTILAVKEKVGSTGKLMFGTVKHDYSQEGPLLISEEKDNVYPQHNPPNIKGSI